MIAMSKAANHDAREAVALACRLYGRQRGWHVAANLLGISDRTARAIQDGTSSGATIPPATAMHARATLRRERAAQLRAELAALENAIEEEAADQAGAPVGMGR